MSAVVKTEHPHIERRPGVCGGSPVIQGTRLPVRAVAEYVYRQGMTPEEMASEWPGLTLAQIHDALSYYHDHKAEIEEEERENTLEHVTKTYGLELSSDGFLHPKPAS